MSQNNLKAYTVKVGSGSGCVFQPMDEEHTYILTAKHLFQSDHTKAEERIFIEEGSITQITFQSYNGDNWSSRTIDFEFNSGVNFFPHSNVEVDAVILKIPHEQGFENIHVQERANNQYYLCGFPGRLAEERIGNNYDSHLINDFLAASNFFDIAKLDFQFTRDHIAGMSGGGIMAFKDNLVLIVGIQSRMATGVEEQVGQIGYIPIKYYKEIIVNYKEGGLLCELLPAFFQSFNYLVGDIFDMNSGPLEKEREDALSSLLKICAVKVSQSDITPISISNFIDKKLLLMSNQDSTELQKKRIWSLWFELLTILNIAKNKSHKFKDFDSLFNNVRFFYSDTNKDFLGQHLEDLLNIDYTNLKEGGLVVFASNIKSQGETKGVLKLNEILPNIAQSRRSFFADNAQQKAIEGMDIGTASGFPFDKYRYSNISTFKEEMISVVSDEFLQMTPNECLIILKSKYEQLIRE